LWPSSHIGYNGAGNERAAGIWPQPLYVDPSDGILLGLVEAGAMQPDDLALRDRFVHMRLQKDELDC
jgi:hypothetical protein